MPPSLPQQPQILTNWLGEPVTILPRQPGETTYAYRNRRNISLTGESLYQRRIRQGQARGLSTQAARGQAPGEAARRRQQTIQRTGLTPWQLWSQNQVSWLTANGFTPETTGWSWNRLIRIAPRLRWINEHSTAGGAVTPDMILDATTFERTSALPSEWTWERINVKFIDMQEYLQYHNREPGRFHWFQDRIPELPVQWWYYH